MMVTWENQFSTCVLIFVNEMVPRGLVVCCHVAPPLVGNWKNYLESTGLDPVTSEHGRDLTKSTNQRAPIVFLNTKGFYIYLNLNNFHLGTGTGLGPSPNPRFSTLLPCDLQPKIRVDFCVSNGPLW
jgi:hypothetical protein